MRHAALVVALLALLAAGSGAATVPVDDATQPTRVEQAGDPAGTTLRIQLEPDGDAQWNVTTRFSLRTENETAAFERLAADYEDGKTDTRFSTDVFRRIADRAETRTGRDMSVTGVNRTAAVGNDTGSLTLRFTWTNFSQTTADRIMVGDVFRLESGTWLSSLSADQALIIVPPDDYDSVRNSPVGFENATIRIDGPRSFEDNELSVTFVKGNDNRPEGLFAVLSNLSPMAFVLGVMGLVGGLGVFYVLTRDRNPVAGVLDADGGATPADDTATSSTPAGGGASAAVDEELLSDEERVERLLERNGGRMMQANIVKETKWSNAKVSQLLSAMADEGRINKLRIGRENLITFPDEDVSDFDS